QTHTPIMYLHYVLQPGAEIDHPVPAGHNALAYVVSGLGAFGPAGREGVEGDNVIFARDGDTVRAGNTRDRPLSFLLLAGAPIREPVVRYGPFVMNTRDEIYQAIEDYHAGRMGRIGA